MSENGDQKITEFISITSAPIETAQKYLRRFDIIVQKNVTTNLAISIFDQNCDI